MKVMVTGGTGFLGKNLIDSLVSKNFDIVAPVRRHINKSHKLVNYITLDDIDNIVKYEHLFSGVDVFIHTAAIAHTKNFDPVSFDTTNFKLTISLAQTAVKYRVKRFIFISSIGVNGTSNDKPFKANDKPNPVEPYSMSKYKAEIELLNLAKKTGLEVVIIRPPLIYGKNAPGNFASLSNIAKRNIPLPLGAINNRRSFVAIDNLIDLIITCTKNKYAGNQTFLVSDDEVISTTSLLRRMKKALGKKNLLIPVPVFLMRLVAVIIGKKDFVDKLSSSLTIDIEHTKETLNWHPPISVDEGIRRCFK